MSDRTTTHRHPAPPPARSWSPWPGWWSAHRLAYGLWQTILKAAKLFADDSHRRPDKLEG